MVTTPPARRLGRILSLGLPLPGPRVDNYNLLSAPSFFDYDALVVDMHALVHLVERVRDGTLEPETLAGRRVCLAPAGPDEVALADVLARRRDETQALLANGGVVVVLAQPPAMLAIGEHEPLSSYWWLPTHGGAPVGDWIVPADGTQAHVVDDHHPMAPFLIHQLANIAYRARFAVERIPSGAPRVIACSYGGAPVAIDLQSDPGPEPGRIVLLPALNPAHSGDARYAMSDALQACIRRMVGVMAEGREPSWLSSHELPGLREREERLAGATARLGDAQREAGAARAARDELARYRALLWQEGALGLEPPVLDALRAIGFTVYAANPDEIEVRLGDRPAFVEIGGAGDAVGLAPHYRLRQRIERAIDRRGAAPRGIVLINGHRLLPPGDRPPQASSALRLAAETMRYCVATTATLFDALRAQLSGDTASVERYRDALLTTDGIVDTLPLPPA